MSTIDGRTGTLAYTAFRTQKAHARTREIPFKFTFSEWLIWWEKHLGPDWFQKRGRKKNQFCMARKYDSGAYETSNVMCILNSCNARDRAETGSAASGPQMISNNKLLPNEVALIFKSKDSITTLALKYGVSPATIKNVKARVTWQHVTIDL